MIVNIRATHGGGKSTAVRAVLARGKAEPIYGVLGRRLPEAYRLALSHAPVPTFVLGPYTTECGGCDRIPRNEIIMALVTKYAERGNVLFEGSLVSSTYGSVGTLLERWGKESVFVFLDTPLEECIRRVEKRRGRGRDERLIRNITAKYRSAWRVHRKIVSEGGMRAIIASTDEAPCIVLTAFV